MKMAKSDGDGKDFLKDAAKSSDKGSVDPQTSRTSRKRRKGAVAVSELALPVLEPILARRAGMRMDLIAGWPAIVGEEHALYTLPEKIKWPRRAHEDDPFAPGTLIVACDGARAVLFQHETAWVRERVNGFFGFGAIDRVQLLQKPVVRLQKAGPLRPQPKLPAEKEARLKKVLGSVSDPDLRKKLEKLGRGIMSKGMKK